MANNKIDEELISFKEYLQKMDIPLNNVTRLIKALGEESVRNSNKARKGIDDLYSSFDKFNKSRVIEKLRNNINGAFNIQKIKDFQKSLLDTKSWEDFNKKLSQQSTYISGVLKDAYKPNKVDVASGIMSKFGFGKTTEFLMTRKLQKSNATEDYEERQKTIEEARTKELKDLAKNKEFLSSDDKTKQSLIEEVNKKYEKQALQSNEEYNERLFDIDEKGLETIADETIKVAKKTWQEIEKIAKEAWKELLNVASYATSTSLISNSSARNQQLQYGLSESQNYAFSQVKSLMNISSDEDLFYMNSNQREMFSKLMSKQMEIYEKMTANGTLEKFQEMSIEFQVMKQEFMAEVVTFIANNKDTIISVMKGTLNVLSMILNFVSAIANAVTNVTNFFTNFGSQAVTSTTDTLAKIDNSTSNNQKTYNITMNNNATMNSSDSNAVNSLSNQMSEGTLKSLSSFFNS